MFSNSPALTTFCWLDRVGREIALVAGDHEIRLRRQSTCQEFVVAGIVGTPARGAPFYNAP